MKRFVARFTVDFDNKTMVAGTLKGHALEEVKTKAWRLAIDNAIKFANGRDIDNLYINVTLEYGSKYFDSDELFGAIRDGEFIHE